ncbi:MAG TPA: hypothetical protein VGN26_10040 [Armatimonadota bacterium]
MVPPGRAPGVVVVAEFVVPPSPAPSSVDRPKSIQTPIPSTMRAASTPSSI